MFERDLRRTFGFGLAGLLVAGLAGCGGGTAAPAPIPGVPQLGLSATTLSFGSVTVGASSAAQTITVTNSGTAPLTISSVVVSGDFSETATGCSAGLAVNTTCRVAVVFAPTAAGARTGTLTLTSNAAASPQTVALSGTGMAPGVPQLGLSATALSFGSIATGLSSAAQTITVTNSGTAALTISNLAVSGDFSETATGCSAGLAVNATCQVAVVFTPTVVGARTGTLTLTSNAAASPQTVALSGTGMTPGVPALSVSASALSFGAVVTGGLSATQSLTLSNSGTGSLAISGITASGDFSETSGCGASLAVNASCQVAVVFGATAAGTRAGVITIGSNAAGSSQTVALSGTGVAQTAYPGVPFSVTVRGGTQADVGASVQLYVAGTRGNGSAGTSLGAAVTTSATGMSVIPSGYMCPSATEPVYVVSRGGTVGGAASANANVALMTAIGPCNGVVTGLNVVVDEATTVAAAYGLAQFYGAGGALGATGSNLTGIGNAFATAATLADPATGLSPGAMLPSNAGSPAARVNSVANVLNACVASGPACAALYSATKQGSVAPGNTLDAVFALARNPGSNVATLYAQSKLSTAYGPALTSAPSDWTMFVNYTGGGMNNPSGMGVDSAGNVWVANYFNVASKLSTTGAAIFASGITGSGLNNSYGLAIDLSDNAWIPNEQPRTSLGTGSVSVLTPAGASAAGTAGYVAGGLNYPLSIAIDPNGTVWVVDFGSSHVTLLNLAGTPLSGTSGYTTSNFAFPVAVAVDGNHFGWVVNQASDYVTKVAPDGSSFTNYLCCDLASGIAIDQGNNLWIANYSGDSVSLMTNAGTVISNALTGLGSIYHPQGIAVDGAGNVWVANYRAPYVTELAGANASAPGAALSPATGLGGDAGQLEAYALTLDASGNVWVSNLGSSTVTKFIGLATPVKTPLSALPTLP